MKDRQSFIDKFEADIDEKLRSTTINLLILGPSIDGTALNGPARLRKSLLEKCPELGVSVFPVVAEISALVRAAKKKLKREYNLCLYEMLLVDQCDLIILIPASPGSFSELGMFSMKEDVCKKALVLFDRSHRNEKSFVNEGPRRAYKNQGAIILDIDYGNIDHVISHIKIQIEKQRAKKLYRELGVGR